MAFGRRRETLVLHQEPSDSPGYVRLLLRSPVGHKQASEPVIAEVGDLRHEIHLHSQRQVDVPAGSKVTFPDGSQFQAAHLE